MDKTVQIFLIHSENCEDCQKAEEVITQAIKTTKISCKILKFLYDTQVAINIAIKHDIDDLPGFVIGKQAFKGTNYTEKKIIDAIKEAYTQ